MIFHITGAADWEAAKAAGVYTVSTRGKTLEDVGYIHCGFRHTVLPVAEFLYADATEDLVLLGIDEKKVTAKVRVENLEGGQQRYPHIYGPLNLDAVVAIEPFVRGADGRFVMPERWRVE